MKVAAKVWASPLGVIYPLSDSHPLVMLNPDLRTREGRIRRLVESAMIAADEAAFKSGTNARELFI